MTRRTGSKFILARAAGTMLFNHETSADLTVPIRAGSKILFVRGGNPGAAGCCHG